MNKFKHGGLVIIAAFSVSACSVSVSEDSSHWRHKQDTRKIICEMVDSDALNKPEKCEDYTTN